jgi:hypothetical protein
MKNAKGDMKSEKTFGDPLREFDTPFGVCCTGSRRYNAARARSLHTATGARTNPIRPHSSVGAPPKWSGPIFQPQNPANRPQ